MKHITRIVFIPALCAAFAAALNAAPLAGDTPVHASPDYAAPVMLTLKAGDEPSPATAASAVALPEGWQAISITAALDVWVRDSELNKELDVKPGVTLRAEPKLDAASLGTMAAGDITELRGIQGKWVQMHIIKKSTGYINTDAPTPPATAPAAPAPAPETTPPPAAPPAPAETQGVQQAGTVPYAPHQTAAPKDQRPLSVSTQGGAQLPQQQTRSGAATTTTTASTTAPTPMGGGRTYEAKPADAGSAAVPRTFEGTFASTRRAFMPRRPYEFQLTAADGTRLAYLDLGKIVVTEQFETYIGRTVVVNGSIAGVPNTQDIVIKAETLQAK
ncbi:hypothetical protein M2103_000186 [Ereboglobus sp. PH5-5]|uniref:SH3 domain-containing protein n=1 Tax=Ereboglobus sp. PH5-5 TaxID=2940529 RepID=UPI0024064661|nr:SH3 domain-containing protein [Ereboglobus sp. PH5-5]MDF9831982.1 hypothetical protein [Ereboglobus sp. PH5-5]